MRFPAHIRRPINVALFCGGGLDSVGGGGGEPSCIEILSGTTLDGDPVVVERFDYDDGDELDGKACGEIGDPTGDPVFENTWEYPWVARPILIPCYLGIEEFPYANGAEVDALSGGYLWSANWVARLVDTQLAYFGVEEFAGTLDGDLVSGLATGSEWSANWVARLVDTQLAYFGVEEFVGTLDGDLVSGLATGSEWSANWVDR